MTNNIKTIMNIIDYLKNNKINYIAGKLKVSDGKKEFIPYNNNNNYSYWVNNCSSLFKQEQQIINNIQDTNNFISKYDDEYNNIIIDTNEWVQLDIDIKDDDEYNKLSANSKTLYNNLLTTYPYYKSATKKYGVHILIGKKSDLGSKSITKIFDNNESICEYSNYKNNEECKKMKDEYAWIEVFCGTPAWCYNFTNCVIQNYKQYKKTTTKEKAVKLFKDIFKKEFIKNPFEKKEKKVVDPNNVSYNNNNNNNNNFDFHIEVLKLMDKNEYLNNCEIFRRVISAIVDKGDEVKNCLKELGKSSPHYDKNTYDNYFENLYVKESNKSKYYNFGVCVNLVKDKNALRKIFVKKNRHGDVDNLTLANEYMKINENNIYIVKNGANDFDIYLYNEKLQRWFFQSKNKEQFEGLIRQFILKYVSEIRLHLNDKLEMIINELKQYDDEDPVKSDLEKDKKNIEYKIKSCEKKLLQVKENNNDIQNIIKMIQSEKRTNEYSSPNNFDKEIHLLPFNNCVYNLRTFEKEPHKRENYISLYIDYKLPDWNTELEEEVYNEYLNDFTTFYDGLFNSEYKEVQDDLTFILMMGLVGRPIRPFPVFNGKGSNGKSVLFNIFGLVLTDTYYHTLSGNEIRTELSGNQPNPNFSELDKKRFCVFREVGEGTEINCGTMKQLGEDSIKARALYSNSTSIINMCNYVIMTNDKPKIIQDGIDKSIVSRIKDIYLPNTFMNEEEYKKEVNKYKNKKEPLPEYIKLKDGKYENTKTEFMNENMKLGMLYYLIEKMKEFEKKYGNIVDNSHKYCLSKTTEKLSKKYLEDENIYLSYINEYIQIDIYNNDDIQNIDIYKKHKLDYIPLNTLYLEFKNSRMIDDILDGKKKMKALEKKTFMKAIKAMPQLEGYVKTQITRGGEKLTGSQAGGFYLNNCYFKWDYINEGEKNLFKATYDKPNNQNDMISDSEEEDEIENKINNIIDSDNEVETNSSDSDSD